MPIPHTYRVIGKIGAGNSGEIYKAYQINLGKYVGRGCVYSYGFYPGEFI